MKKIGITGQNGFVGTYLYNVLGLYPDKYQRIEFKKEFFNHEDKLDEFVQKCDVIIHLAAMNRHKDPLVIYYNNIDLVKKLTDSLRRVQSKAHIIFSSSSQEEKDNLYGKSKKEGRTLLADWAVESGGKFTGMIVPNVFGPFGKPEYNSFIATFCHKLINGNAPSIDNDSDVKLIYVAELVEEIIRIIDISKTDNVYHIQHTSIKKVSEVLAKLENYKKLYFENGHIPELESRFDINLFNTFRSYINPEKHFPIKFKLNKDNRGAFVEIIRLGVGGQCSFSTTVPGITRGNHYHTRKIERFAVIKGKALIKLRKINDDQASEFFLDGDEPAYVDMPIWYTHSIKNIGNQDLYTIFWINEVFDASDADTHFLEV
ncbi:NAD-dependent epimerase/dehydratase family protein [uncultured Chryseobacterium sp.]|uniref:polysaccharide biosynthesis C-terminal domain-containing protein n=1 Tax=uncultured Chryseobacterium sp. TaxID=259322 RepID=UPI0025DA75EE|nr:NAD-dependent epimerase/dehydratase family protein [uncultured Chryseobacterium sp.]